MSTFSSIEFAMIYYWLTRKLPNERDVLLLQNDENGKRISAFFAYYFIKNILEDRHIPVPEDLVRPFNSTDPPRYYTTKDYMEEETYKFISHITECFANGCNEFGETKD